ncbi:MAG: hypothetical protein JNL58_04660 [Planctomyces sp.]|nr:hypothetical protein [Planctomyces sp.]
MSSVRPSEYGQIDATSVHLPGIIRHQILRIRRRLFTIAVANGLLNALTIFIVLASVSILIDWGFVLFDTRIRILLTLATTLAAAAALVLTSAGRIAQAFGWTSAAREIDHGVPQMEERWQTVASLAEAGYAPADPVAKGMLAQVTSEAVVLGQLVDPKRVVPSGTWAPQLKVLGLTLTLMGAFIFFSPVQSWILILRFMLPASEITATSVKALDGDLVLPRGARFPLTASVDGVLRDTATLTIIRDSDPNTEEQIVLTEPQADGEIFSEMTNEDGSFQYRFQVGDGRTPWHRITLVDPPAFSDVKLTITPPAYIDEPAIEKSLIPQRTRVLAGSRLTLALKPDQELQSLTLRMTVPVPVLLTQDEAAEDSQNTASENLPTDLEEITLQQGLDGWYHFETQLTKDIVLTPIPTNVHGFLGKNPRSALFSVYEDKAPVAHILNSADEAAISLDEPFEVKFEAFDDHGVAKAEIVIYEAATADGKEPKILGTKQIPLGEQALNKHVHGAIELDLREFGLLEGQSISYAIRVRDNRDASTADEPALAMTEKSDRPQNQDGAEQGVDATESSPAQTDSQPAANTPENTATDTAANTPENTATGTAANTPENTATDTAANTPENTATDTEANTPENNAADTAANTPENTATDTEATTPENTAADTEANTPENTATDTAANTPENTATDTAANTPENTATETSEGTGADTTANTALQTPAETESTVNPDDMPEVSGRSAEVGANQKNPTSSNRIPVSENPAAASPPPTVRVRMNPQDLESGQQETERRQVRIVSRLDAVANSDEPMIEELPSVREKVLELDRLLEAIETRLRLLHRHEIEASQRGESFQEIEDRLKEVEIFVAGILQETRDTAFEFVGLQMADISGTHITPSRDAIFLAIRSPDTGADVYAEESLHHVVSARELLQALLRRYDAIAQERELEDKLDKYVKMYTVYVERSQRLMREAQQNFDPLRLQREMAVLEVDQTYLDRLAEVLQMRREMMSELAKILEDDPRLRSRYLDLIRRRRSSLGSQLAELLTRQKELGREVSDWNLVNESQRTAYWDEVTDLRLDTPKELAKEAQQLADRITKQLPLVLNPDEGTPEVCMELSKQIALDARRCEFDVQELRKSGGSRGKITLSKSADALTGRIRLLAAALDRLAFEGQALDGVTEYVDLRQVEVRALLDRTETWSKTAHAIEAKSFGRIAGLDQHQLTIVAELFRTELQSIETDLAGQFNEEVPVPAEVGVLARQLQEVMEAATLVQMSATYALQKDQVAIGSDRQQRAIEKLEKAVEILNELRTKTAEALDQMEVQNPNIADLQDPTLDQFLAELEREPNIEAQLGIPNRPRNIRVIQDSMQWNQVGGGMLGESGEAARSRMQRLMNQRLAANSQSDDPNAKPGDERQDREEDGERQAADEQKEQEQKRQEMADSSEMQKMLRQKLEEAKDELDRRAADAQTSDEERRQLQEMAAKLDESMKQLNDEQSPGQVWQRMVEMDQTKAILEALAKGEKIPDDQWNKLISTLADGTGQVSGRVPPEDYRGAIEQYQEQIRRLTGGR